MRSEARVAFMRQSKCGGLSSDPFGVSKEQLLEHLLNDCTSASLATARLKFLFASAPLDDTKLAKALISAIQKGEVYPSVTFKLSLEFKDDGYGVGNLMAGLYKRLQALPLYSVDSKIFDPSSIALMLIGGPGTGTGLHSDPASAFNIAYFLSGFGAELDPLLPLARWLCINPLVAEKVNTWVKANIDGCSILGLATKDGTGVLQHEQMKALVDYLGYMPTGEPCAYILDQFPGQAITVAAGWMHSVLNVQFCVKYAVEFLEAINLPAYAAAFYYATYFHGGQNADPYVFLMTFVVDYILKINAKG